MRTRFYGGMFCFARAEALVVDAPPDVHAPFLNLGDEMSTAARLWTRGWDFFAPHRNVVFHLYKNNYRNLYFNEDRRMGLRLYADEAERYGSLDDVRVFPPPPSPPSVFRASVAFSSFELPHRRYPALSISLAMYASVQPRRHVDLGAN